MTTIVPASLHEQSIVTLRKTWYQAMSKIDVNDIRYAVAFDKCWTDWSKKYGYLEETALLAKVKHFIQAGNKTNRILRLPAMTKKARQRCHVLCEDLGIQHESLGAGNRKAIKLTLPLKFSWEFSGKNANPMSTNRKTPRRTRLYECENCSRRGNGDDEIMISIHYPGIFCTECINSEMGNDGEPLDCHKWEPAKYGGYSNLYE